MISDIRSGATSKTGWRLDRQSITRHKAAYVSKPKVEIPISEDMAALERAQQRMEQIAALSMTGTPPSPSENSWLDYVGKYSEDSPLVRILDAGARIRESERNEQC